MQNAIIQRTKDQLRNLKILSEELRVQMALGRAEARDALENEQKSFSKYVKKQAGIIDQTSLSQTKNRLNFLKNVESLESKLNTVVPDDAVNYSAYKSEMLNQIYKMEEDVRDHMPTMSSEMKGSLETLKAKMDAYRLNLALHDKDDPEKVQRIKNEFTEKLDEIRLVLAKNENDQTKIDQFSEDIKTSYKYLKQAINDLS